MATCQTARTKPRHFKSRSNGRRKQDNGNGYDHLQGAWLTYYKVASRFAHKAKPEDTQDLLHDIIVTLADVKKLPQDQWANTPVQTIMTRSPLLSVRQDDDLNNALKILAQNGLNQIPVTDDGRMVGLLSRADVIRYLQTRQELGIRRDQGPRIQG